jgi:hypothetical protein
LPAQSVSGPSPLELETIFYCLRLETSLFVAFYDSQGHGGGIRPRLHTGVVNSHSHIFSYPLGTDHAQKTQFYYCVAQTTQKTSHAITISPVHWRADYCLTTSYKHSSYCYVTLSEVFIAPLPSSTRYNMCIMAHEHVSTAYFVNPFNQAVCICVSPYRCKATAR